MEELLRNPELLRGHIRSRLLKQLEGVRFSGPHETVAAVLFLLGMHRFDSKHASEACLIFNQRSRHVRQPGDLCFPGGGLAPLRDRILAGFLRLPGFPLFRWASRNSGNPNRTRILSGFSHLLATSLRESFEEMRINPFRIRFLGPMAPEPFPRFDRMVYPMVAWSCRQAPFSPNWEVERIVYIPFRHFFDPGAYGKLPISHLSSGDNQMDNSTVKEFPCLIYEDGNNREILWGLTYRIVMRFLDIVFNFRPPDAASVPVLPN